jgi:hypothetical protein
VKYQRDVAKKTCYYVRLVECRYLFEITQFIEVIIRGDDLPKYAITADFTRVQRSPTYLSRQFSPDGKISNYSFEYDSKSGSLFGHKVDGDKTSKLEYLKLYPVE